MDRVDKLIDDKILYFEMLYRDIETETLIQIARMIAGRGFKGTPEQLLKRLSDSIGLDKHTLDTLKKLTGKSEEEVLEAIHEIGIESVDFNTFRKAYDLGRVSKDIDLININPFIVERERDVSKILKEVHIQTRENAFKQFKREINKAVLETHIGVKTPYQAMVDTVKAINKQGLHSATYDRLGKEVHYSLEPTVMRVIRTEMIKTSNEVAHNVGEALDVDTWYITQHLGARDKGTGHENHESWQGQVVNTEELETIAGYGLVDGLGGVNCRHRHYAYIKGVSIKPPPKINTEDNARVYALEQKQRGYERAIRKAKQEIVMLSQFDRGIPEVDKALNEAEKLLKARQKRIRDFIKSNKELTRDYTREKVVGY